MSPQERFAWRINVFMVIVLMVLGLLFSITAQARVSKSTGAPVLNQIAETIIAFGSVPASYGVAFVDLGTAYTYDRIEIVSTLDEPVYIKVGTAEFTVLANEASSKDGLLHNGELFIKHKGAAPTTGSIVIKSF